MAAQEDTPTCGREGTIGRGLDTGSHYGEDREGGEMTNRLNWYGVSLLDTIFTEYHRGKTEWDFNHIFVSNTYQDYSLPTVSYIEKGSNIHLLIDGKWVPVDERQEVLSRRFPVDCTTA
jgi:hypothetical protein